MITHPLFVNRRPIDISCGRDNPEGIISQWLLQRRRFVAGARMYTAVQKEATAKWMILRCREGSSEMSTPDSGAAGASPPRDFQHWQALGGKQHDLRPLNLLERTISIADDRKQALAIFGADYDVDGLGHAASGTYPAAPVNPTSASVH